MSFFNQDISQGGNQNLEQNNLDNNQEMNNNMPADNNMPIDNNMPVDNNTPQGELEFNRKNREDYENLMQESSTQLDGYWDKNNPFVKLILLVLLGVIVAGVVYYVLAYMGSH